jgi:drug/metabolite transporter (DMT)-like permease
VNRKPTSGIAPHLALITVQLLFGTWPIVGKIVLQTVPSVGLVAIRVAGGAIALAVIGRITGGVGRIRRPDWPLLILSSLLGLVLNQLLYTKGLSLTTVINTTLLSTTIPVFTLLVGLILRTDYATLRRVVGIALAASGVVYLIGPARAEFSALTRVGDLLIVTNSLCYGAYIAVSKDLVGRYSALTVITWIFILGTIATVPFGVASFSHISLTHVTVGVWLAILYIILLPTVGAYYLNAWALARVPPSTVAVYIYFQPLIAFTVAPLLLGEKLGSRILVSSLLIFAGVLVVTRRARSRAIKAVAEHPEALGH